MTPIVAAGRWVRPAGRGVAPTWGLCYHARMSALRNLTLSGPLVALFGLAGPAAGQAPQPQADPQYSAVVNVGDAAPAFKLPGSDGKVHSLQDLKGTTVVLAWFPKAFTGG